MQIRVSCVKYLNSLPFIQGIQSHSIHNSIHLSLDTPAECYQKLSEGTVDIGLVPVTYLYEETKGRVISRYCIGSRGKVKSVILVANQSLETVDNIYLDYQSKTSVNLVKVLARHHWKRDFNFIKAKPGFESSPIPSSAAYIIIGDRAFDYYNKGLKIYDLGEEWFIFSGLPFVFACWTSNKQLPEFFISEFNDALNKGLKDIKKLIEEIRPQKHYSNIDFNEYFQKNIHYNYNENEQEGLKLFLNLLAHSPSIF